MRVSFDPTHYHGTIGSHEPALTVDDGDTIVTTTLDAGGVDAVGNRLSDATNPQTGPFFVSGAEPGDALAVRFDRITPTRQTAETWLWVAPHIVDPDYVPELPRSPGRHLLAVWQLDLERRTATLPDEGLTLPIDPMLGCFGVAPPDGQAIGAMTSGRYGGNMDYRGFRAGTTVYLPVFTPGALFHLGDGHALQGDGELVGSGLEVSMEVEFTVGVRKGMGNRWPRGEDAEYVFAVGNARPLEQALQHATTEMLRWLQADFGLGVTLAHQLLGFCVEYDVGNVYDPAYTMVCKLPKRVLGL